MKLYSTDGIMCLKDKYEILDRWVEHFWESLNKINPSDHSTLEELLTLPQVPKLDSWAAIKTLKNKKKSPYEDSILGKIFKYIRP